MHTSNLLVLALMFVATLIALILLLAVVAAIVLRARRGEEATWVDNCALVCVAVGALLVTIATLPLASLWNRVRGRPTPLAPWERRHS